MNRKIYPINYVMFIPQHFSDFSNGFKLCLNKFKLRRHGIINQNTFRCLGSVDETEKRRKNVKCHCLFVFKVKGLRREFILFKTERSSRARQAHSCIR